MVPSEIKNRIAVSVYKAVTYGKNIPSKITRDKNVIAFI